MTSPFHFFFLQMRKRLSWETLWMLRLKLCHRRNEMNFQKLTIQMKITNLTTEQGCNQTPFARRYRSNIEWFLLFSYDVATFNFRISYDGIYVNPYRTFRIWSPIWPHGLVFSLSEISSLKNEILVFKQFKHDSLFSLLLLSRTDKNKRSFFCNRLFQSEIGKRENALS